MKQVFTRYATIRIEAFQIEQVLKFFLAEGIVLHSVRRVSHLEAQAQISQHQLKKAQSLMQGKGNLQVLRQSGYQKVTLFVKRHILLSAGVLVLFLALFFVSRCCLFVRVTGTKDISEYSLYQFALENGANRYTLQSKTDVQALKMAIWQAFPELSYVHVDFEGVILRIDVREHVQGPEIADVSPSNIYATKDGVINEITVRSGRAVVAVGDKVSKGDLLITGHYQMGEQVFQVPAVGSVKAQAEYIHTVSLQDDCMELQKTGNVHTARVLCIGNRQLLLSAQSPYKTYVKEQRKTAVVGENMPFFFEIWEVDYFEATLVPSAQKEQLAILSATEQAYMHIYTELPEQADVRGFFTHTKKEGNFVEVSLTVSVMQNIAVRGELQQNPIVIE